MSSIDDKLEKLEQALKNVDSEQSTEMPKSNRGSDSESSNSSVGDSMTKVMDTIKGSPYTVGCGVAAPFVIAALLWFIKPKFVQDPKKKDKVCMRKLAMWTLGLTAVIWGLCAAYNFYS